MRTINNPLRLKITPYTIPSIPYDGADWVVFEGGIPTGMLGSLTPLQFDTASVGANNPNTNVVDRIPLPFNFTVTALAFVAQVATAGSAFNVVSTDAAEVGTVPAPGVPAAPGQSLFAIDMPLLDAGGNPIVGGEVVSAMLATPVLFPVGSALTQRLATPAGGGVGLLKLTLFGQVS